MKNRTGAAPYPSTDAAEQETIALLYNLINHQLIKLDVKSRDKYPNVDGYIEIVGENGVPLGKMEVQIRKIAEKATKYQCPSSLVAYSEKSTLPVLLICMDTVERVGYWRHICREMPEYKPSQQSFVIRFGETDTIDGGNGYIHRWIGIVSDYQRRVADFPILSEKVADLLSLDGISHDEISYLQQYIDTINVLLDTEFPAVKRALYSDVWKLGVGIISSDNRWVSYQLYKIPSGRPYPLICKVRVDSFLSRFQGSDEVAKNAVERIGQSQMHRKPPKIQAEEFVFDKVRRVVKAKLLPIRGKTAAADILFAFTDRYSNILGLDPKADELELKDFDLALNERLLRISEVVARRVVGANKMLMYLDLDAVSEHVRSWNLEPSERFEGDVIFVISSRVLPIRLVFEALKYLQARGVNTIQRPFPRRKSGLSGRWIWSGYGTEKIMEGVRSVLSAAIAEYAEFIAANQFRFPRSPYLDLNTSIIFVYRHSEGSPGPVVEEFHVDNSSASLPKLLVYVANGKLIEVNTQEHLIRINGRQYEIEESSWSAAGYLFDPMPVVNQLYRFLTADLYRHFGVETWV